MGQRIAYDINGARAIVQGNQNVGAEQVSEQMPNLKASVAVESKDNLLVQLQMLK